MRDDKSAGDVGYGSTAKDVDGYDALAGLALNMRGSWNHATDEVWRGLDPALWELTQNPWVVLQTVSRDKIKQMLGDPAFRQRVEGLVETRRRVLAAPAWFQRDHPDAPLRCVAYFSMEFMLSEALPIYSGGLGNVAGDQLKAASDLGVPVVGVGLLFQQGYFRQVIGRDGGQEALYPYNDPGQLPISPLRQANGEWLRLEIPLPGGSLWLRAWQVQVGRVRLYLLDSNDAANHPIHRGITSQLYGGGPELRLQQEMVLGMGGWRMLGALGLKPEVCHLNEGHAAFAVLERAHAFMQESGLPFDAALDATRAGNVFTTHTAVAAGFDLFEPALAEQYLAHYAETRLGIPLQDLLALGRRDRHDRSERFNMAYLALRGCGAVNGVSQLHGEVSRQIFSPLFPAWPLAEVPVGHVTNGVHMPTWDSALSDELWTEACGKDRWLETKAGLEGDILGVPDDRLWRFRTESRKALVDYARERLARQLASSGLPAQTVQEARLLLDPDALTLGFARRFAAYKRPNLLLHDRARLLRLLGNPGRPVQLIIAGKAHPEDRTGQELIREWISFIRSPAARPHVIFLSDYDMQLTERLVQGVDVWVNTPRRPWEACGTSGMKVLVNGGLNLSELDGWWAEAYAKDLGWALGDGGEHGDDPGWDAVEADALYGLLENEVIPEFYTRGADAIPAAWVGRIRASMAKLTPRFSAGRAVRDYTEGYYLPAAERFAARSADKGALGARIAAWRRGLDQAWGGLRLGGLKVQGAGPGRRFEVEVRLNGLDPKAVKVELYADGVGGGAPERHVMAPAQGPAVEPGLVYGATVVGGRPDRDYTARVAPCFEGLAAPLEEARVLWQTR
jgi:starch phosphorylase